MVTREAESDVSVRRIRADEWSAVRDLRLESTSDPDAAIAFLERPDEVAARPDEFWKTRAAIASQSDTAAQFVAVTHGDWVGALTVIIRAAGEIDYFDRPVTERRADVVGVYVRPSSRGSGAVDRLLDAAARWVVSLGLATMRLDVHRDNHRAQAAYRRTGFEPTGVVSMSDFGPELEMVRIVESSPSA